MVKRAVELEGTVTGEHGVGLVKRDYLNHELGETTVDTMRRVSVYRRETIWKNRLGSRPCFPPPYFLFILREC